MIASSSFVLLIAELRRIRQNPAYRLVAFFKTKPFDMKNVFVFAFITSVIFLSCKGKGGSKSTDTNTDSTTVTISKDSQLILLTKAILTDLKNKDYTSFATYIHPTEGVRFSPYAFVDSTFNILLPKDRFETIIKSGADQKLQWGEMDGTGDPILYTVPEYFDDFVYDADFLNPEKRSVNEFIGGGSMINNLETFYPGADFTESYFSGFDKKYDGMDWKSLRLVFKKVDDKYYLVAVIHDEWTI